MMSEKQKQQLVEAKRESEEKTYGVDATGQKHAKSMPCDQINNE